MAELRIRGWLGAKAKAPFRVVGSRYLMLRDLDIRRALRKALAVEHADEDDALIVDELGLCQGAARVDLAIINGSINGFEIKSDADRLHRLARQMDAYGAVLDTVTLVTSKKHLANARKQIPPWWGIIVAKQEDGGISLRRARKSRPNRNVQPIVLAQLLWRDEALELLSDRGLASGMSSKPRSDLWRKLATELSPSDLALGVRTALKQREGWRAER